MSNLLPASAFEQALRANRSRFNAKFAEARHFRPRLTGAVFKEVLQNTVAPVVEAVAQVAPNETQAVLLELYEVALDLLGQELLGPQSRLPYINHGWQQLLPNLATFVAQAPRQVVGSITNALYQLSQTAGARPAEWLNLMLQLAPHSANTDTLLKAGQVAAWRAGMAHYRTSALQHCAQLPPTLVYLALGLPPVAELPHNLLAQLSANPWFTPGDAGATPQLKQVARVGAFRGFGGLFLHPPSVRHHNGQFVVQAQNQAWVLFADTWGATFHRLETTPKTPANAEAVPFKVDNKGKVSFGAHQAVFPVLAPVQSFAANATTLAVTSTLSHAVFLFALV